MLQPEEKCSWLSLKLSLLRVFVVCALVTVLLLKGLGLFFWISSVLRGDFLQRLPVVKGNLRSSIVHTCLLSSPLWSSIKHNVHKPEKKLCVGPNADDQPFASWLKGLELVGILNADASADDQTVALPPCIVISSYTRWNIIERMYLIYSSYNITVHYDKVGLHT